MRSETATAVSLEISSPSRHKTNNIKALKENTAQCKYINDKITLIVITDITDIARIQSVISALNINTLMTLCKTTLMSQVLMVNSAEVSFPG